MVEPQEELQRSDPSPRTDRHIEQQNHTLNLIDRISDTSKLYKIRGVTQTPICCGDLEEVDHTRQLEKKKD